MYNVETNSTSIICDEISYTHGSSLFFFLFLFLLLVQDSYHCHTMVIIDAVWIQKEVIASICCSLGNTNVYRCYQGSRRRTSLGAALKEARDTVVPKVSISTIRRWWNFFIRYGDTPAVVRRNKYRQYHGRYVTRSTSGDWNTTYTTILTQIVDDQPDLYLDEIQNEFITRTGKWFTQSWLWKKLCSECRYSLQVSTDRASQRDEEEREDYLYAIGNLCAHPSQLVYIDETQKDRNSSRRRRQWSRRGVTPFRDAYFVGSHGRRYTMLAAADWNGFIVEACEMIEQRRSNQDENPERGTVDRERFRQWVEEKLVPVLGNYRNGDPRSIVVCDNAEIHNDFADLIEEATGAHCAKLVYTAPYSPDLNPIEYMFGEYKKGLKKYHDEHWKVAHLLSLYTVTPAMAKSFFKKARCPLSSHFPSMSSTSSSVVVDEYEERRRRAAVLAVVAVLIVLDDDDDNVDVDK